MHYSSTRASSRERRPPANTSPGRLGLATVALTLAALAGGCVLAPAGLREERDALEQAGSPYEPPLEERSLPELSAQPGWRELLARGFAANGEVEAAYFEWKAALKRVTIAAGYPNTNLAPSLSYMISGGGMKFWDRTTVNIGFDPMQNLSLPSKVRKDGEIALAQAREAGQRFAAAKFALQRQVLDGWLDLALLDERARIQTERVDLAKLALDSATQRASSSGEQRDLLRAQVEWRQAEIDLAGVQAQASASRAALNGMLARDASAKLTLADTLPDPRPVPTDDAALIAAGVGNNPELRALAFAVDAREGALERARLEYLPDFNPFVGFTGSVQQMLGVGVSLPTRLPQIRAGIEEARAMLRGAGAELRQTRLDLRASFVAALYMLRFSERQATFLAREVDPVARQVASSTAQAYATGAASFLDLIDAQRVLLDVRMGVAEARIERERRLAELEQLAGLDVETLTPHPERAGINPENDRHE